VAAGAALLAVADGAAVVLAAALLLALPERAQALPVAAMIASAATVVISLFIFSPRKRKACLCPPA
jgi:ABC-type Fe3+-siderophore transport system permease subunit